MKRFFGLVVLMLTASAAQADSISFSVGGHRIRVDAPRNCRSSSCASISIPGIYESRRKRWDDEDRDVVAAPPPPPAPPTTAPPVQQAPPPAPIPSPAQQVTPPAAPAIVAAPAPASRLTVVMVPAPTPLAIYKPAAATTQEVAPPPPAAQPPVVKPVDLKPAAPLLNVLREDDPADSPIGDWQTGNKGLVRIAECGRALCGYTIKPGDDAKGEAVLINMKPKTSVQWTGSVYSKDSGDTYYGSIKLNGSNTLRVEACAFGRFYCNGNHWTRVPPKPDRVITSRQIDQQPRS